MGIHMPKVIISEGFKYAFRGVEVVEFEASTEEQDIPEEVADLAVEQGWATLPPSEDAPAVEQGWATLPPSEDAPAEKPAKRK
jgi:hypothetical protein